MFEILGNTVDKRTNTKILYVKSSIDNYLTLVGGNFDDFTIQRKREKHKIYKRLKEDIKKGTLLPGITLAIKSEHVNEILENFDSKDQLKELLKIPNKIDILDGLQRTYILNDLKNEGHEFFPDQSLLLEYWLETDEKHLIYRLLVLNAGQKSMSPRHQVEILFSLLKGKIEDKIPDLKIYTEKETKKRTGSKAFQFDRVANAYQCFLSKSSEVKRENIIAERLQEDKLLLSTEEELKGNFDEFVKFLQLYCDLDEKIHSYYSNKEEKGENWLNDQSVIQSFFAAISKFATTTEKKERVEKAINKLIESLDSSTEEDPLGLGEYNHLKSGYSSRKYNVGVKTREYLVKVFSEYFRDEGDNSLKDTFISEAN